MSTGITAASTLAEHYAACMSEGYCPEHEVPFTDAAPQGEPEPRFRCAQCGPLVVWWPGRTGYTHRMQFDYADQLAWKPLR